MAVEGNLPRVGLEIERLSHGAWRVRIKRADGQYMEKMAVRLDNALGNVVGHFIARPIVLTDFVDMIEEVLGT